MSLTKVQLDLNKLRRQAKDLLRDARSGDVNALDFIEKHTPRMQPLKLAVAQLAVARSVEFSSWSALKRQLEVEALKNLAEQVEAGDVDSVSQILKEYPQLAHRRLPEGATLLHDAVWSNDPEMARTLVKAGVPLGEMWQSSAHTAMSWAITIGSYRFAEALVELGDKPDLFCAAGLGALELVKSFWIANDLKPNPSRTGSSRFSPDGQQLQRPPENAIDQVSDALYIACRNGHVDVALWLLGHGADPNFRGYEGGTALHWAETTVADGLSDAVRQFGGSDDLEDYTFKAKPRQFGLMVCASYGMADRLNRLLDRSLDEINTMTPTGSPLHAAAARNQTITAKILLDRGADRSLQDPSGRIPEQVAREKGYEELANELK